MKRIKIFSMVMALICLVMTSCTKDLNTSPIDPNLLTANIVFANDSSYGKFLAQCYGSLVMTGLNSNPGWGDPDFVAGDEGTTSNSRALFTLEEISTDEVFNYWGGDLNELHFQNWSDANLYIWLMYERSYYNIVLINQFIAQVNPRISGLSSSMQATVKQYVAEARFLRALNYFYAMDLWGNVPFVTENDPIGNFLPPRITRANLYAYIESELKAISPLLMEPNVNYGNYGRANKASAWMLLAKLYLNSEVYTGSANYGPCVAYCDSIIQSGVYKLHTVSSGGKFSPYLELFLGDNSQTCSGDEIIFPIRCNATQSENYGGSTYLYNAEVSSTIPNVATIAGNESGEGWGGNTTTYAFMQSFSDMSGSTDSRALFFLQGVNAAPVVYSSNNEQFSNNLPLTVSKYRNLNSNGQQSSASNFMNNDIPLFRYADVYLMYAEASLRLNGSADATSLGYVNQVLSRAYTGSASGNGNITLSELTLPWLMAERGREFYWEMQRRTDLIRFGQFTNGTYLWDWKGQVAGGRVVDSHYNLYPLPAADLSVNTNLIQNPGY